MMLWTCRHDAELLVMIMMMMMMMQPSFLHLVKGAPSTLHRPPPLPLLPAGPPVPLSPAAYGAELRRQAAQQAQHKAAAKKQDEQLDRMVSDIIMFTLTLIPSKGIALRVDNVVIFHRVAIPAAGCKLSYACSMRCMCIHFVFCC